MLDLWHRARNRGINADLLTAFVDSVAQSLDASQRLNFLRWPILSQRVHQNPVALGSFSAEVNRLKQFLPMRINWMDSKLGYTFHSDTPPAALTQTADTPSDYRVYDLYGRLVYSGTQMPQLPQGIYIIQHNNNTTKLLQ
jgi:hypothetical protein